MELSFDKFSNNSYNFAERGGNGNNNKNNENINVIENKDEINASEILIILVIFYFNKKYNSLFDYFKQTQLDSLEGLLDEELINNLLTEM
jgi:hypothetical protein